MASPVGLKKSKNRLVFGKRTQKGEQEHGEEDGGSRRVKMCMGSIGAQCGGQDGVSSVWSLSTRGRGEGG